LDHVSQRTIDLSKVDFLVLDEADRMLDMGFINDIRKILDLLPKGRQGLLFSATFSEEIKNLARSFLNAPKLIEVAKQNSTAEGVSQVIHPVDSKRKKDLLAHLIKNEDWKQVLVFTRTKHGANRLADHLEMEGIPSVAIHGNKTQAARAKALSDFKAGKMKVLVATDIASRGIDIDQLPYVVNYELPNIPESYVHRIGRTGRAGSKGVAVSLVCIDEWGYLRDIERLLKQSISKVTIAGYEPNPSIKAQPIVQGSGRGRRPPHRGPSKRGGFRRR
jgi:ATP-dependent RNA helicase RhlE